MQITILAKTAVAFAILVGSAILPYRAHAQTVAQAPAQAEPWVSTAWLQSHLHDPDLVLLQVRATAPRPVSTGSGSPAGCLAGIVGVLCVAPARSMRGCASPIVGTSP